METDPATGVLEAEIFDRIGRVIERTLDVPKKDIKRDTALRQITTDSLELVGLIQDLEDEFQIDFEFRDNPMGRIEDVIRYVEAHRQ